MARAKRSGGGTAHGRAGDVIVAGGGLVGLAAALALAGPPGAPSGLAVHVLDAARPGGAGGDPRASAVTAASRRMLAVLGVWPRLAAHARAVTGMAVSDTRPGAAAHPPRLTFATVAAAGDGTPALHIVENGVLLAALAACVRAHPAISVAAPARALGHRADGAAVTVVTQAGAALRGRLLVAADGAASALRRQAGIATVGWDYGQAGVVASLRLGRDHGGVAVQHFLPGGPLALLPLPGRRAALVWSMPAGEAARLVALDADSFLAALAACLGRRFGRLALDGAPQSFPLAFHAARELVRPRLALAGDAAHRFHPLAGLGVNMGFKDAAALAEVALDAARLGLDIGSPAVLERYQRWRRFDAAQLAFATDALNRLFSNDRDVLRLLRDTGLGLVDRLPALKSLFVREAAGDTGTLPRLMRGAAA